MQPFAKVLPHAADGAVDRRDARVRKHATHALESLEHSAHHGEVEAPRRPGRRHQTAHRRIVPSMRSRRRDACLHCPDHCAGEDAASASSCRRRSFARRDPASVASHNARSASPHRGTRNAPEESNPRGSATRINRSKRSPKRAVITKTRRHMPGVVPLGRRAGENQKAAFRSQSRHHVTPSPVVAVMASTRRTTTGRVSASWARRRISSSSMSEQSPRTSRSIQ